MDDYLKKREASKTRNMKRLLFFTCFGLFGIVWLIVGGRYTDKQFKREYDKFNEAEIAGRIATTSIAAHGAQFQLKDASEFIFYPNSTGDLSMDFLSASPGDSIVKHRFSDTLLLMHDKRNFWYTFQKPKIRR